jgi:hypothetical protein
VSDYLRPEGLNQQVGTLINFPGDPLDFPDFDSDLSLAWYAMNRLLKAHASRTTHNDDSHALTLRARLNSTFQYKTHTLFSSSPKDAAAIICTTIVAIGMEYGLLPYP